MAIAVIRNVKSNVPNTNTDWLRPSLFVQEVQASESSSDYLYHLISVTKFLYLFFFPVNRERLRRLHKSPTNSPLNNWHLSGDVCWQSVSRERIAVVIILLLWLCLPCHSLSFCQRFAAALIFCVFWTVACCWAFFAAISASFEFFKLVLFHILYFLFSPIIVGAIFSASDCL